MKTLGEVALRVITEDQEKLGDLIKEIERKGYTAIRGKVGSMKMDKVIAAIETAAKREEIIAEDDYSDLHALYHAIVEALQGICRGELSLGSILRTVGLNFVIVKGPRNLEDDSEDKWIAVLLYGTIGAPIKGYEHESIGLGINHLK